MANSEEQKAQEYIQQAEKKLNSSNGFIGRVFGGSNKQEEACELYIKAANSYKMAKNWSAAGNAFVQASKINNRQDSKHDAASHLVDASNCFKKSDPVEAVNCLIQAIEIYTDMGRFSQAARYHVTAAEIYENEGNDITKAITHYEKAADYYHGEESTSHANKCLVKVAQLSAQQQLYEKAAELYEQIGRTCLDSTLLKYAARDHFFRAVVCRLCIDLVDSQQKLQALADLSPSFADSREYVLLKDVMEALQEQSVDQFTAAVQKFDAIRRLDTWETSMLLRIKKQIEDDGSELR